MMSVCCAKLIFILLTFETKYNMSIFVRYRIKISICLKKYSSIFDF